MHIEVSESLIELQAFVAFEARVQDSIYRDWYRDIDTHLNHITNPDMVAFWLLEAADRKERDAANERLVDTMVEHDLWDEMP